MADKKKKVKPAKKKMPDSNDALDKLMKGRDQFGGRIKKKKKKK